jgi:anti-sigma regulatory factor (Ser/Thr protein kinase)
VEVTELVLLDIADASASGHARGIATDLARRAGFDSADVERARLVATEAATNLVKHAKEGELLLQSIEADGRRGVACLALDKGPGMASVSEAMRDGFTTAGSPGTGLGAIRRLATRFDVFSTSAGVALLAILWADEAHGEEAGVMVGGVNVPHPKETVSGDAWSSARMAGCVRVLLSDGLGHGPAAAAASAAAVGAFQDTKGRPPGEALQRIHDALRPTRGAAVAIAEIDRGRAEVRFAGLGNIAATIIQNGTTRSLVSHHGTAGHDVRRIQEFTYPWDAAALLVLHSDGLSSHWTLEPYPGLRLRHPMLVAGVLYRDFKRGRDDASVVVLREAT